MLLGLDCSTQSLSALILDTQAGTIVTQSSVNFEANLPQHQTTSGFVRGDHDGEVFSSPLMWLDALDLLLSRLVDEGMDLSQITAISGSGQQHATVYLNSTFSDTLAALDPQSDLSSQLAPCLSRSLSPIWMDSSTSEECAEIAAAMGGDEEMGRRTGSTTTQRFSGPQIRRFFKQSPDAWAATDRIHLTSSFLASVLAGKSVAIDHGDGAGMNLMNLRSGEWDETALAATAPGLAEKLPPLAASSTVAGTLANYFVEKYHFSPEAKIILWSGDNPCSLVGMGAASPGKIVISLGTSYTLFAAMDQPRTDPDGYGHVFGNPCGNFMSLICFHNGALCSERLKNSLGLSWEEFDQHASVPPTSDSQPSLPFFEAEITPLAPAAPQDATTIRSLLDGQFLNMLARSQWMGTVPNSIYVTGGTSQSHGVCQTIANIFNANVQRMETNASAALGAAMRAGHATGYSLEALEASFTQPMQDSLVTPDANAVAIYQRMAPRFDATLKQHLSTPT